MYIRDFRFALVCFPVLVGLVCGCQDHNRYELELKAVGPEMERTLVMWRVPENRSRDRFPPAELKAIAALYPTELAAVSPSRHAFRGEFGRQMPADIGGSGSYQFDTTSLGTAAFYVERFRGSDDVEAHIDQRRRAADDLTGILIGWFQAEMRRDPRFAEVREFLDRDFRRDLKNLSHYWALARYTAAHHADREDQRRGAPTRDDWVRVAMYLVERNYFRLEEVPGAVHVLATNDAAEQARFVVGLLARKIAPNEPEALARSLAFLTEIDSAKASLERYLRGTPRFRRRELAWERAQVSDASARPPDPNEIVIELVTELFFGLDILRQNDELRVTLVLPQPPYATNGAFIKAASQVVWSDSLGRGNQMPAMLYAAWSMPDAAFQLEHLGGVILGGEDLANYVAWFTGLGESERRQWEGLLVNLKQDIELRDAIGRFQFASPPPALAEAPSESPSVTRQSDLAGYAKRLLLANLPRPAVERRPDAQP
jgi:hypothetical protein